MYRTKTNRPSKRHVWEVMSLAKFRTLTEHCKRCGTYYVPSRGGTAALYCYPSPAWRTEHPEDDMKEF